MVELRSGYYCLSYIITMPLPLNKTENRQCKFPLLIITVNYKIVTCSKCPNKTNLTHQNSLSQQQLSQPLIAPTINCPLNNG